MKILFLLALLVSSFSIVSGLDSPQLEDDLEDEQVTQLSKFLISLISKYDQTGSGEISKNEYPLFLKEVFLTGSNLNE